ncbi:MAG: DUF2510 domain-containing protein [Streptosporangiaceae bacterium]
MSYQQPPDRWTDPPSGPPQGWYPDPGGRLLRWWDGTRWGPQTQPLPGDQSAPHHYPDDTAGASGGFEAFRQQSTGQHAQQTGSQDGTAYARGLASGGYPATARPEPDPYQPRGPQDPYQPAGGPQQSADAPGAPPQRHRALRRPRKTALGGILIVGAIVAAGGAALGLWLGGVFGPSAFTAHGGEQVCGDAPDIADGTQVTVTDSSGHVIGTGTLAEDDSAAAMKAVTAYDKLQASLGTFGDGGLSIYDFTVTGLPGGETRYGISIGQDRGTVFFSEKQMRAGPALNLGC